MGMVQSKSVEAIVRQMKVAHYPGLDSQGDDVERTPQELRMPTYERGDYVKVEFQDETTVIEFVLKGKSLTLRTPNGRKFKARLVEQKAVLTA